MRRTFRTASRDELSAAIVSASLHLGKYEPEMAKFVKRHLTELQQIPGVFLSVSLAARTAEEGRNAPSAMRAQAEADVKRTIDNFLSETGWHPSHIAAAAGALPYSKYNFVTRFIMKLVKSKECRGSGRCRRELRITDWNKLDLLR